jgi:hypothetical protein
MRCSTKADAVYQLYGGLLTKLHGMRWSTLAHAVADTSRLGHPFSTIETVGLSVFQVPK